MHEIDASNSRKPLNRSWAARIFISPDEPRPRAGWRMLAHALLFSAFIFPLLALAALALIPLSWLGIATSAEGLISLSSALTLPALLPATWLARKFLDRRSFSSLGLLLDQNTARDVLIGFVIAGVQFGLIFGLERCFGWLDVEGWSWDAVGPLRALILPPIYLLAFAAGAFAEELWFRGYYLQNLTDGLNLRWAVALSSLLFALAHGSNPNASWISALGLLLAGLYFAYAWLRTRSLWLPVGLHLGWNFFEGTIFGFPVSGLQVPGLLLISDQGPSWLTGGTFGPEAGLVALPAMLVGAGLVALSTRGRA